MGIICMIIQKDYPDNFIEESYKHDFVQIWLAPAHGLFLNCMDFGGYNKKEGIPELIEFNKIE